MRKHLFDRIPVACTADQGYLPVPARSGFASTPEPSLQMTPGGSQPDR